MPIRKREQEALPVVTRDMIRSVPLAELLRHGLPGVVVHRPFPGQKPVTSSLFATVETDESALRASSGTRSPRLARREPQQTEVATESPRLRGDVDVHDRQVPRADGAHQTERELRRARR